MDEDSLNSTEINKRLFPTNNIYWKSAECNGRKPRSSEERKNYILDFYSFLSFFPPFLLNQRFKGFFPLSSGFQRVNEGNKQEPSFLSPHQFFSLAEVLI